MAGIGFELRKAITKGGLGSFLKAAFSGIMIVAGRNGGTFTGRMRGQVLSGLYRAFRSNDTAAVEAALNFIYAITGTQIQLR